MITRYTARALTGIDLAILWYEEQRRGLGTDKIQTKDHPFSELVHGEQKGQAGGFQQPGGLQ